MGHGCWARGPRWLARGPKDGQGAKGWTRMAKAGRDRPRLAEIGRGRPRLAGVGRDWPRFAEIGRDWPRCAKIGRGWPEIRRERPSLASFCVGSLSRCLTSLTLGFRFREIHWLLPGPALGARQMGRLIDPLVVNLSVGCLARRMMISADVVDGATVVD